MKIEKAIEILKEQKLFTPLGQACHVAIEALDKQVPREPRVEIKGYGSTQTITYIRCPICNTRVGDNANIERCITGVDYCSKCGQLIDWLEVENE